MRAIVVGAGIAGLVTARQLGLAGWQVDVMEKSPRPRSDGYMMDFFGPGVAASEQIGLYPRLARAAYQVKGVEYLDAKGRVKARLDYERFARFAGGRVLSLLRPDMEHAALAALDDVPSGRVRVHYGTRLIGISQHDERAQIFTAGRPVQLPGADLIVGADGIHSEVRALMFGPENDYLRPLGMRAAAFIVDDPELSLLFRNRFVLTDSINRAAGIYGVRTGEVAVFLVYRDPASGPGPGPLAARDRLRNQFTDLGTAVDRLMEQCPDCPYDDVVAQITMPLWHQGRVVLVGDSCAAVSLLAGQGGSLAVAAGALLGDLLRPVDSSEGIISALEEYERQWQPVVITAQASGRRAASSFLPVDRSRRLLRRCIIRATKLPGVDRLVARQILRSIAK